jgi:hypothetical protein
MGSLSSLGVRKFDQAFDLEDGQGRETFSEFVDCLSEIEAVNNRVGQNAGTARNGPAGNFARDFFDQLAGHPVEVRIGVSVCHSQTLLTS